VVNRVLPAELRSGNIPTYLRNRIRMQEKYLGDIQKSLGSEIMAYVPEMERDVTGLPMIERLARQLFEDSQ
jgi:arsenite/tail-anchored protein-transporting ATPase